MLQASGPGENAGYGVGAGRPSLRAELRNMLVCLTVFLLIMNVKRPIYYISASAVTSHSYHMMAV